MTTATKSRSTRASIETGSGFDTFAASDVTPAFQQPAWLRDPELAAANAAWRAQARSVWALDERQLRQRVRSLLREEISFINNPLFQMGGAGDEIFNEPIGLDVDESAPSAASCAELTRKGEISDLPAHLSRLCEAKLLSPEQERMLFQRMNFLRSQAAYYRSQLDPARPSRTLLALVERCLALADWHRDRMVEANMRLVFSIVKKFVNRNNVFDDLLSDGIIALMRAVDKFDYDRGFRFSTYATQVVRRNAYRTVVQKQKEKAKMVGGFQELGLDVSDEERQPAISERRWHELRSRLAVMLGDLDRREKFIIRARFSLGSHAKVHTLQSLADRLGVSKERVRQLEKRALDKLRLMAAEVQLAELES
ncbi:sigma-70 family RNA polymerase sigma factor [Candidatus Laterigemmans baculatus]|uniref:sigma-70 family RNA polymerase sigma factor n=1 Tax=Candidatus Laterigemmans baculatus TaxID=2770505 RepID=UPI0013DBE618|nr:sigma-70 family RNA polymerase sigma factor [Candidatus Laterigemmans baculatus]